MNAVVIYESMYGNTHQIASAIGRGLAQLDDVRVGSIGEIDAASVIEAALLVVGGPTHVHGLSRESTRASAVTEAQGDDSIDLDDDAPGPGLREWLAALPKHDETSFAAFDTRVDKPVLLTGSAAKGISKRLKRLGYVAIGGPESFFVDGNAGPLREGEEQRAQQWAATLANDFVRIRRAAR